MGRLRVGGHILGTWVGGSIRHFASSGVYTPPVNVAPTAAFVTSVTNLAVTVTSTSTDPDGTIASHSWVWGDGATSSGPTATHTYATAGPKTVTLTVTDNSGATATASETVTTANPAAPNVAPTAAFTTSQTDLTIAVVSTSTDSDGSIVSYEWSWGDSTASTGTNPSHTYATPGTYTVTLTVTDDKGATGTTTRTVTPTAVPNVAPTASFTTSTTDLTVTVTSASTDSDGTIAGHSWAWGDGATSTGATASHTYAAAGTYTITLTVIDDNGDTAQTTRTVTTTTPVAGVPTTRITATPDTYSTTSTFANWPTEGGLLFQQGTVGRRPTLQPDAFGTGKPGLAFDGTDDYIDTQSPAMAQNAPGITIFFEGTLDDAAGVVATRHVFFLSTAASATSAMLTMRTVNGVLAVSGRRLTTDAHVVIPGTSDLRGKTTTMFKGAVVVNYATAKASVWVNGVKETEATFQTAGTAPAGVPLRAVIGSNGSGIENWKGVLSRLRVWDQVALTDTQIAALFAA